MLFKLIRPSANPFEQLSFSILALKDTFVSFIVVSLPHGNQKKRRKTEENVWMGVAMLSFRLMGTTKNISVSSLYRDSIPSIAEVWSAKQLADWQPPVWEEWSRGRSFKVYLQVNPHNQLSIVPLSTHHHPGIHAVSAMGPPVCVSVRFPRWKITHSTDTHKSVRYVVDYYHSILCSPAERGAMRLSVSPLSSHPPEFKTLSALRVKRHAHTHACAHTRAHTHTHKHTFTHKDAHRHITTPTSE